MYRVKITERDGRSWECTVQAENEQAAVQVAVRRLFGLRSSLRNGRVYSTVEQDGSLRTVAVTDECVSRVWRSISASR